MTLKDFWEKVQMVREKLNVVAKYNPTLSLTKAFDYLKNVGDVLKNYENDYRAGRHQTLPGFKEMAQFNLSKAEQVLSEAYQQTINALKETFSKKAHGRVEAHLIKAVLLRADEVLRMEGFASAKRLLERADYAFYLVDYDLMVNELRRLAGLPVLEVKVKKSQPASREEYFKRPFAIKVEKVAHKETAPTAPAQEKAKTFTGRFVGDALPISRVNLEGGNILKAVTPDMRRAALAQSNMAKVTSIRTENVRGTRKRKASEPRSTKAAVR